MNEIICPLCNASSPEKALYCQQCSQPLRCQDCGANLLPIARACIQCGKLITGRSMRDQAQVGIGSIQPGYNRLKFHETSDGRDLDFMFSNEAIANIGDSLLSFIGTRPKGNNGSSVEHQQRNQTDLVEVSSEVSPLQPQLPATSSQAAQSIKSSEELIWKIFKKDDEGVLKLDITSLKATGKWDHIMRLVHLFLYAKMQLKEDEISRTEVYAFLNNLGLLDVHNIARFINKAQGISSNEDGTLRLTYEGRTLAQQYIADVFNDELTNSWPSSSDVRPVSNRTKKPIKKSGERRNGAETNIREWVTHHESQSLVKATSHNIIVSLTTQEKGLLSLYALNKVGIEKEVGTSLIKEFLYETFKVDVPEENLRKALVRASEAKRSFVNYRKGQGYRITPSGCEYIENKLKLKQPQDITAEINTRAKE